MVVGNGFEDSLSTPREKNTKATVSNSEVKKVDTELTTKQSTTTQPRNSKKRAGPPMTKEILGILEGLRDKNLTNEENDLTRLLRLDSVETQKIASLKSTTKLARGVQESIRDELRPKLAPIQIKLQSEVTELENTAHLRLVELKDDQAISKAAEAAVILAKEKLRKSETKIVDSDTKIGDKKKMQVLVKRFGDGEELDEGEMERVLVERVLVGCKGGV